MSAYMQEDFANDIRKMSWNKWMFMLNNVEDIS